MSVSARSVAALAIAASLIGDGAARAADAGATGSVNGSVQVMRPGLFGGLGDSDDRGGVVVYVTGFQRAALRDTVLLAQRDKTFEPHVLVIVRGQTVSFPNRDPIYHNVFSVSPLAPFDLGQYKSSDPPKSIAFDQAGLIPVYCNIHPQMLSYVVVLENDAFAVTSDDGRFAIGGIPAGTDLMLNAWAPGAQRVSEPLRVAAGEVREVSLRVEQTERIPPHRRKDGSAYPKKRSSGYGAEE